jgi:ribosomally synthesized peptide (two-chain TOMM family)
MSKETGDLRGDEPLVEAWNVNTKWRSVWLRAIAKAWQDEAYKKRLLANPQEALRQVGFGTPDFFQDQLKIVVEEAAPSETAGGPRYESREEGAVAGTAQRHVNGWVDAGSSLRATLTLKLPPPPAPEARALALADYDAAGRVYPFTMC